MTEPKKQLIYIRKGGSNEVEHVIDVTGKSSTTVDKVIDGLSQKVDFERFWIDDKAAYPDEEVTS